MTMNQRERRYKDPKLNAAADELWSYRQRQFEIKRIKAKSEEYRDRYSAGAIRYDAVKVDGGAYHDKLANLAVMWVDMDIKIRKMELEAENELWRIHSKLQLLSIMQSKVLELYYIKGYSVMKVAQILDYSEIWVRRVKFNALKKYAYL